MDLWRSDHGFGLNALAEIEGAAGAAVSAQERLDVAVAIDNFAVVELLIGDGEGGRDFNVHDRVAVPTSMATIDHVREVSLVRVVTAALEVAAGKDRLGRLRVRAVVKVVDADDRAIRIFGVATHRH